MNEQQYFQRAIDHLNLNSGQLPPMLVKKN